MEQARRRKVERRQYKKLVKLTRYIEAKDPSWLNDTELEALGFARSTNLDVDNDLTCDFDPRFFSPCSEDAGIDEVLGGMEHLARKYQ